MLMDHNRERHWIEVIRYVPAWLTGLTGMILGAALFGAGMTVGAMLVK
jgi:hypothetical protein